MDASDVIAKARDTLLDPDGVRWTDEQMLSWLGDAMRAAAVLRPSSAAKVSTVTLTANQAKQALPADGFVLFDVRRNMGADGATPGPPILECDLHALRSFDKTMYSMTGEATIYNYGYDKDEDPLTFWVSPRAHASTVVQVEIVYGQRFSDPADTATTLTHGVEYLAPFSEYLCYKAFAVDTDIQDPEKVQAHMGAFASMIKALDGAEAATGG